MRILHTSDWHLGKLLEGNSRLKEQQLFLEELEELADERNIDLILLSGDVYDTSNPPAQAEKLFYSAMNRLSQKGKRPIVVIAGNHDNPDRLTASYPIACEQGILLIGTPKSVVPVGDYGFFSVLEAGEGYFELELKGEKAVILTMPYPSEKRLNELAGEILEEEEMQKSYSAKIGALFRKGQEKFREDTINLAMAHLFVVGGNESGSERPIQLGGSLAVNKEDLPDKAQYIALGHLHRPQTVGGMNKKAFYSGSPLPYSKDEILYSKGVQVIEAKAGKPVEIERVLLKNYKPIECWEANSIEEAITLCNGRKEQECWVYLKIKTARILERWEMKEMRTVKADIVEIEPVFEIQEEEERPVEQTEKNMREQFCDFYFQRRNVAPGEETIEEFLRILNGEDEDEADTVEDKRFE